jgi:hypothetical protein
MCLLLKIKYYHDPRQWFYNLDLVTKLISHFWNRSVGTAGIVIK